MAKITANVMQTLRREIDEKMHHLKLDYYDTHTHGDILSVITNDVDTINNTISQNLTAVVTQVTTAIGVLVMMLMISPKLSFIPIIMVPLSLLSAAGVMRASEKYYGEQQDLLGKLNGYVEEMYNGQSVVQTFNYQERAKSRFAQLNEALKTSSRKAETTAGAISPITTLPILLGLGLRKFSVNPSLVLAVKQVLANSSVDEVKQLAIKACETNSAEDVRKLIKTKSGDGCYGDN